MDLELVRVAREDHWQAYHHIRRHVLFELRGRDGYDDQHPDEYRRGHIPFLLLESGNPVGTVRFDLESEGHAVVRLVAVLPARQRRGLGRAMMAALENEAIEKGVRRLKVHSAPDAVPFYEKLGWTMIDAAADHPLMMKELPVEGILRLHPIL